MFWGHSNMGEVIALVLCVRLLGFMLNNFQFKRVGWEISREDSLKNYFSSKTENKYCNTYLFPLILCLGGKNPSEVVS